MFTDPLGGGRLFFASFQLPREKKGNLPDAQMDPYIVPIILRANFNLLESLKIFKAFEGISIFLPCICRRWKGKSPRDCCKQGKID